MNMQNNNRMGQAKPFVKWAGGKTQLITQLERMLPVDFHNWDNVTYIEPFIGGEFFILHAPKPPKHQESRNK